MLKDFDPNQKFDIIYEELYSYICTRDNYVCQICGKQGSELHHIEMKSEGGKNFANNLILLCPMCHRGQDGIHGKTTVSKYFLKERVINNEKKLRENLI